LDVVRDTAGAAVVVVVTDEPALCLLVLLVVEETLAGVAVLVWLPSCSSRYAPSTNNPISSTPISDSAIRPGANFGLPAFNAFALTTPLGSAVTRGACPDSVTKLDPPSLAVAP
jgi:hypothetical protein